ncbi:MAG: hypothetical protein C5B60_06805 [Chloroflexi bacterium]|nr:MAG: hypothetical protein C5B60_06805 [Chloroflexota bacterium]
MALSSVPSKTISISITMARIGNAAITQAWALIAALLPPERSNLLPLARRLTPLRTEVADSFRAIIQDRIVAEGAVRISKETGAFVAR